MKKLWMKSVSVVCCALCLVVTGIGHTWSGEYNPPWLKVYQDTPDWFRDIKDLADDPAKFPVAMRLLDRGIREGIKSAACLKAKFILSEQVRSGGVKTETLKQIPQLLAPYRFDQCPFKPTALAAVYKFGLGADVNAKLAEHYVLKMVVFDGATLAMSTAWMAHLLPPDGRYDIWPEISRYENWFDHEFEELDPEEQFAMAEAYFSGKGVPKDLDVGYALLLSIDTSDHTADSAYRAARGAFHGIMSFGKRWLSRSGTALIIISALRGHPEARRDLGVELMNEADGDPTLLLHGYAYLLWAKYAGAKNIDPLLAEIARRSPDPGLEAKAQQLISESRQLALWQLRLKSRR